MYPYTSQEKDHQFVTSGRFSGPQHHMHYSGKYCFHMSTCNADSSYTVSTHKLFIKRVFHCVLRLLEGQFLKTKNRNLLDRQLQVPHHSQHNPEASSKRSCFPLGYAAKLAYLVSQVTTFFFYIVIRDWPAQLLLFWHCMYPGVLAAPKHWTLVFLANHRTSAVKSETTLIQVTISDHNPETKNFGVMG